MLHKPTWILQASLPIARSLSPELTHLEAMAQKKSLARVYKPRRPNERSLSERPGPLASECLEGGQCSRPGGPS